MPLNCFGRQFSPAELLTGTNFQCHFRDSAAKVLGRSYAEFIAADIVVAAVDERSPEVACGPAIADNDHLLTE
jgi:hypothetical protein